MAFPTNDNSISLDTSNNEPDTKAKAKANLTSVQDKLKAAAFAQKKDKPIINTESNRSEPTPTFKPAKKEFNFTDEDLRIKEEGEEEDPLYDAENTRTSESPFDPYESDELPSNPDGAQQFFNDKLAQARAAVPPPGRPAPLQKASGYSDVNDDAAGQGGFASQINSNQQTQNPSVNYNNAGGTPTPTPKNSFNRPVTTPSPNGGMNPFHNKQEYDNTYSGELAVPTNNNPNFVDAYNKKSMIEPVRDNYLPPGFTSNSPVSQTILKSSDAGFGPMSPNMNTNMKYLPTKPTPLAKQQAQDFSNRAVQSVMKGNFTFN